MFISTGRSSKEELCRLVSSDERYSSVKENILRTDALVIDEVSMVSARILTHVEYLFRKIRGNEEHFGGMQIILVGDFFQLPPVRDELLGEYGKYCFECDFFKNAFPHKINLTIAHRQRESILAEVVNELERGKPSQCTNNFVNSLSRPIAGSFETNKVTLFARNIDVDVHNYNKLESLEGTLHTFQSEDEGDLIYLKKMQAPKHLGLKVNCPIVLIKNLDNKLVNGLTGTVCHLSADVVSAKFIVDGKEMVVAVKRVNFTKFDPVTNACLAKRLQFPIKLAYSLTIHKSQGMSIPYLEIDCRNAHYPGQVGVAVGRAVSSSGLRVLNFSPNLCRRHPQKVYDYQDSESNDNFLDSLICCRKGPHIVSRNILEYTVNPDQDYHSDSDHSENNFGEDFCEVLEANGESESECNKASNEVVEALNIAMKDFDDTPDMQKAYRCKQELLHRFDINDWYNTQHDKLQKLLNEVLHPEIKKIENKHFTEFYSKFHSYIDSEEYCNSAILKEVNTDLCHDILTTVMFQLQKQLIENKAGTVQVSKSSTNIFPSSTKEVPISGRGKVRYIGGYVVAKCRYNASRVLQNSVFVPGLSREVQCLQKQMNILDGFIISEAELREITVYEETLDETILKQNIRGSLTHINDKCFEFFEFLEKKIRHLLSFENLMIHGQDLFQFSLSCLHDDLSILQEFVNLYCYTRTAVEHDEEDIGEDDVVRDVVENRLTETVCNLEIILKFFSNLFLKVAVSQFRKNYLNVLKIEKGKALRKKVMKHGQKKNKPITVQEIQEDKSEGKEISQLKLKALALEDHQFYKKFTKQELKDIGKLYGLSFSTKKTVMDIGEAILKVILDSHQKSGTTSKELSDADVSSESVFPEENMPCPKSPIQPSTAAASHPDPVEKERGKNILKTRPQRKKRRANTYSRGRKKKRKTAAEEDCEKSDETAFCAVCGKLCQDDQECICCDDCDSWYHRCCVGLEDEKIWKHLTSEETKYSCPLCS